MQVLCILLRVLLIDNELWRNRIKTVLGKDRNFIIIGEGSTGKDAIDLSEKFAPDLVIMEPELTVMVDYVLQKR